MIYSAENLTEESAMVL